MAILYWKVNAYLEANGKTKDEFKDNIVLQNDGSGDYIRTWNVSGLAQPTAEQLDAADAQATTDFNIIELIGHEDKPMEIGKTNWMKSTTTLMRGRHELNLLKMPMQRSK